jgi:hypothetical protein
LRLLSFWNFLLVQFTGNTFNTEYWSKLHLKKEKKEEEEEEEKVLLG